MKLLANLFKITSTKIGQYPGDNAGDSIIATGEGSAGKGETAQVYGINGLIANPPKETRAIRLRIGALDILIASLNYKIPLPDNPGDSKVYSTDADGNEQATCNFLADGTIEINGNSDFAVAFNDLKTQFDELKTAFNTHTHVYIPGTLATVPTATPLPQSVANIDLAKVDEVKLP